MIAIYRRTNTWLRSLDDVTRLCLGMTVACFLVGAILGLAGYFFPVAPRSVALFAVGGFYLVHAVAELLKQHWRYARWLAMFKQVSIVPQSIVRQRESEWEARAAA